MTDYTLQPTSNTYQASDWADARSWAENMVPNSADADVTLPAVTDLSTGQPINTYIELQPGASFLTHSVTDSSNLIIAGALDVQATLSDEGGAVYMTGGSLSAGTIENGSYFSGTGTVTTGHFINDGSLTGVWALDR